MKNFVRTSLILAMLTTGCATNPSGDSDARDTKAVEPVGPYTASPSPNIGFEPGNRSSVTDIDPEGDIAPLVSCKDGEIERRQSGKIVCVDLDIDRSGSTMSGR